MSARGLCPNLAPKAAFSALAVAPGLSRHQSAQKGTHLALPAPPLRSCLRRARRLIKQGMANLPGTREAIAEQLRIGEAIRKKAEAAPHREGGSDDEDDDESSSSGDEGASVGVCIVSRSPPPLCFCTEDAAGQGSDRFPLAHPPAALSVRSCPRRGRPRGRRRGPETEAARRSRRPGVRRRRRGARRAGGRQDREAAEAAVHGPGGEAAAGGGAGAPRCSCGTPGGNCTQRRVSLSCAYLRVHCP